MYGHPHCTSEPADDAHGYARMGYASALAWVLFLIVLVLTLVVLRSSQYRVFYSGERE